MENIVEEIKDLEDQMDLHEECQNQPKKEKDDDCEYQLSKKKIFGLLGGVTLLAGGIWGLTKLFGNSGNETET